MQTDRELLELCTRALNGRLLDTLPGYPTWAEFEGHPIGPWDPLADDGDALRLAVACQLSVSHEGVCGYSATDYNYIDEPIVENSEITAEGCLRRAIVRAAAAIGETL